MINVTELKSFVAMAKQEIDNGAVEDKLRHLLSSCLNKIFPDSPWWVQEHVLGTETFLHFSNNSGEDRVGFADSVVGKTAIEYEKNLTISGIFNEGHHQVKEYCAALCNLGIQEGEILGVLSDTIRWYGYSIEVIGNHDRDRLYGAGDIKLIEQDSIDLSQDTDVEMQKFEYFVNKYLGREQSRLLSAKALVLDFGLESTFYRKEIDEYYNVISDAMQKKPEYADLIKNVWQSFVAYLGASEYGTFSLNTYTNEYYLVTVAKIICANILNGTPLICDEDEIIKILNGKFFLQKNIQNLVDYDYFGWLNNEPFVNNIVNCAKRIQKLLCSYDFKFIAEEDLFGALLAQLSNREHRLLLGQDFTPHWVAKNMVEYAIESLNEEPSILDMCCGSGVFLIEAIKKVRNKYNISIETYDEIKDNIIFTCVMGFDIDPLAIMLAKVNWVMAMKDLFPIHIGQVIIPVYHADSLFVATPITHDMPKDDDKEFYIMHFDGNEVKIPGYMLTPKHRKTFDAFMSICYKYAMNRATQDKSEITEAQLDNLIASIEMESNTNQTSVERQVQRAAAYCLVLQLESLQREGRNGIWYFILSNSYKPGLVTNQFNCIVSNPPWLAMSKLADNPYKRVLQEKTASFGIKPPGASHLHMELATTFLLASIDNYLKDGARWMCIMPGSILSGYHHDPLRLEKYRNSQCSIDAEIDTLWELPVATFKNKAVVLGGKRNDKASQYPLKGRKYDESGQYVECKYTLNKQGNRSAWTSRGENAEFLDIINPEPWLFNQGADIMPRSALFHDCKRLPNGTWSVRKIENSSELHYLLSDSHKDVCRGLEADGFNDQYMYDCLISKHLSPFIMSNPAKVIIPGTKREGRWNGINESEMALMNSGTSYVFNEIQEKVMPLSNLFTQKINIRNKLDKQDFSMKRWLVLSNAGGTNPCAAVIDLNKYDRSKLIIDQTLYWYLTESEDEALFVVGLLNSTKLSVAISDFQPQGGFGARHIHTIPYKIIPRYDASDIAHADVITKTRALISEWITCCDDNAISKYLQPSSGSLNSRRRKLQGRLKTLNSYDDFEKACGIVLCVDDV